ncbi:hypothetical protein [Streptosporangium sp. NBC_01469]|uniref:hypothetical protein n=1 Tax=Streptosporangium sp. NBC_01469 TaxID=2903898 RepID=UPI002E2AD68A|nr:hypothetical protein [Streptosporangium sp. NBC_01469]
MTYASPRGRTGPLAANLALAYIRSTRSETISTARVESRASTVKTSEPTIRSGG